MSVSYRQTLANAGFNAIWDNALKGNVLYTKSAGELSAVMDLIKRYDFKVKITRISDNVSKIVQR